MSERTSRLLEGIKGPSDVRALAAADLPRLAQEIPRPVLLFFTNPDVKITPDP